MTEEERKSVELFKAEHPDIPVVNLSSVNKASVMDVFNNALAVLEGPKFMNRTRSYNGQPWTDAGIRGKQEVKGLTIRDLRDCYIRAYIQSHPYYVYDKVKREWTLIRQEPNATLIDEANKGEKAQLNGNDLYSLVGDVDPIAVFQNFSCEIEKVMGIFPNIPQSMKSNGIMGISEPDQSPMPPCDNCGIKECDDKSSY